MILDIRYKLFRLRLQRILLAEYLLPGQLLICPPGLDVPDDVRRLSRCQDLFMIWHNFTASQDGSLNFPIREFPKCPGAVQSRGLQGRVPFTLIPMAGSAKLVVQQLARRDGFRSMEAASIPKNGCNGEPNKKESDQEWGVTAL
jgi:hypothetical protein